MTPSRMEYYITNKMVFFKEHFILWEKNLLLKVKKNVDAIFHIQCYLHEIYVFAQEEKICIFFVKIGHCFVHCCVCST